jgi:leucyl aminopeptidase
MKIAQVDFVFQIEALGGEQVGNFENSFYASNFEKTYKIADAQKFGEAKPSDSRVNRLTANVESYMVHAENMDLIKQSPEYLFQMAMARAKETSQRLAIVRGSEATPEWMADQALALVKDQPLIKEVRVIKGDELVANGMNLFHNVGRGAVSQPRGVFIHYVGRPEDDQVDLALVGKGITYDTGGLNIKMALMEKMYGDKGGSTAVLGALQGCLELKVKKNIVFACAFAENAIGNEAYKPSDILRAMNGLSVEIGNTDAEGRLVMADTMTYVQRNFNPRKVSYIATLTGSCMVALGLKTAGIFSTDDAMIKALKEAGDLSDEAVWHLPLNDEHREATKGKHGTDLENVGPTRWGGASTAAAFLESFIEDERPWAHIDIAGPGCLMDNDQSGFGAKLLLSLICKTMQD